MATNQGTPVDNSPNDQSGNEAFYNREIEHFYMAELYHDQRASWLLALASGLLTLVLGSLYTMNEGKLGKAGQLPMIVAGIAFGFAIFGGLFALWPLSGRQGRLWNPFKKLQDRPKDSGSKMTTVEHFNAHRRRAAVKASRVIMVIIWLGIGLLAAIAGIALALLCK